MFHYNHHLLFNEKGLEDNQGNDSGLGSVYQRIVRIPGHFYG